MEHDDVGPAYHVTRVCDNLQAEGEDEDKIVGGTIHNQGPEKRHRTNMHRTLVYFDNDHNQQDRLVEVTNIDTQDRRAGRTSIAIADVQAKNPFGFSGPHPVKLSGASKLLEFDLPNTEILPSCTVGRPFCIIPIHASGSIQYDA